MAAADRPPDLRRTRNEWLFVLNGLALALAGRPLEAVVGRRHLVQLYVVAGIVGGLAQVATAWAVHGSDSAPAGGATAASCGIFFALACVTPRTALLPASIGMRRVKVVHGAAGAAALLTLLSAALSEAPALGGMAGGLTGCLSMWALGFGRRAQEEEPRMTSQGPESPESMTAPVAAAAGKLVVPRFTERERRMTPREYISEQIDPILDKIALHGIGSLSAEERRVLDKGREKISHGR